MRFGWPEESDLIVLESLYREVFPALLDHFSALEAPRHCWQSRTSASKPISCVSPGTQELTQPLPREVIAIDGKTIRGSLDRGASDRRKQKGPLHLVSAWASDQGLSLGQECVEAKSNEITAIPLLLDRLHLKNTLVTLDAMGCQTKIAQQILDRGADYLLVLKANHRHDYTTVQAHFLDGPTSDPSPHRVVCDAFDDSHGRLVRRRVFASQDPALLAALSSWPGLQTVLAVESIRRVSGQVKVETQIRYFLCSGGDDPQVLARAIRRHWAIENNLHWVFGCPLGGLCFGKMTVA